MPAPILTARIERWPIAGEFRISRGAKTEAVVVVVELREGPILARGECTPYARYGETPEGVLAAIEAVGPAVASGLTRKSLQFAMQPGAARNALDCALWDLEAKRAGERAWTLACLEAPRALTTAYTLSLDAPEAMAAKAAAAAQYPLMKLKLAGEGDAERLTAIRRARPTARLIVDANEGFRAETLPRLFAMCQAAHVELIEQPLPQGADGALAIAPRPIPVCADESAHAAADIAALADRYDAVNIKLDKTGGLTEALAMKSGSRGGRAEGDGRLHAGDLAVDGAGPAGRARGRLGGPGRAASAGTGSSAGGSLRRIAGDGGAGGAVGVTWGHDIHHRLAKVRLLSSGRASVMYVMSPASRPQSNFVLVFLVVGLRANKQRIDFTKYLRANQTHNTANWQRFQKYTCLHFDFSRAYFPTSPAATGRVDRRTCGRRQRCPNVAGSDGPARQESLGIVLRTQVVTTGTRVSANGAYVLGWDGESHLGPNENRLLVLKISAA